METAAGPSSAAVSGGGGAAGPQSPATPAEPDAALFPRRGASPSDGGSPLTPREAAEMDAALQALADAATAARAGLAAAATPPGSPSAASSDTNADAASLRTLVGHLVTAVGALAARTSSLEEETRGPMGGGTSPASSTTQGPSPSAAQMCCDRICFFSLIFGRGIVLFVCFVFCRPGVRRRGRFRAGRHDFTRHGWLLRLTL